MIILGIESSCDETAAAIVQKSRNGVKILSNVVASSAQLQSKYGGVIPEQAAREQLKTIIQVIEEALSQANLISHPELVSESKKMLNIDAIAATYGPGLIGSLLVGVETAKVLATIWDKPLIPVNHLIGHFYANWISSSQPKFPCIGLLVSGGHTDLVLFENHGKYKYLGGTRDDAAGEAFDKTARLLGLPYPGGPAIAKLAKSGNPNAFDLPRPMIDSKDFDFSFSGLKTAVANLLKNEGVQSPKAANSRRAKRAYPSPAKGGTQDACVSGQVSGTADRNTLPDLCASIEQAISDVLVTKTIRAAQTFNIDQIMVAGGVAANQKLIFDLKLKIENLKLKINLHVPPPELCTDNAAMIASAGFFNYQPVDTSTIQANPNLSLTH